MSPPRGFASSSITADAMTTRLERRWGAFDDEDAPEDQLARWGNGTQRWWCWGAAERRTGRGCWRLHVRLTPSRRGDSGVCGVTPRAFMDYTLLSVTLAAPKVARDDAEVDDMGGKKVRTLCVLFFIITLQKS